MAVDDSREATAWANLASLIAADRARILTDYERWLEVTHNAIILDPSSRRQLIANAGQILDDVIASLRARRVVVDDGYKRLAWEIGTARAARGVHPVQSLRAASGLFETVVTAVRAKIDDPRLLEFVVLALNEGLTRRITEASASYSGYLLDRVHQAHLAERRRIARELHDRVASGLSIVHRQLELYDVYRVSEPATASDRVATAHEAVREAMDSLRMVTAELRLRSPGKSLEKALVSYLEDVPARDVTVHLRVNGDENWASEIILEETFLVMREAIRNTLTHADPNLVLIGVEIAPHELRGWVEDDGRGFDLEQDSGTGGIGVASMRERTALMGGTLTISSEPGHGTRIELLVPLPGLPDDAT